MRTIAIANQKGGCGKTTTAINLSASLSRKGKRVLLVDSDPQAHATMGLNVDPAGLEKSLYNVLSPGERGGSSLEEVLKPINDGLDLVPSSVILSAIEQELSGREGRESRLMEAVGSLQSPYDFLIVDCPPSIGLLSINALRACQEVIIPIEMSLFSLRGVAKLMEIVLLFKEHIGHEIRPRALITMYDFRTRYAQRVLEKVKESFGPDAFESVIRYNIRLRETVDHGLPIMDYDKHSIGNKDYQMLAEEILKADASRPEAGAVLEEMLAKTHGCFDGMTDAGEEPRGSGTAAESGMPAESASGAPASCSSLK
ncbi:MAG: ParA family protein [bacterium]